jgi:prepilin-type N-terminal cleavage/methylation domain-containing protein
MFDAQSCTPHGRRRVCSHRDDAAFTLIEVLIAVTVMSVGVGSTMKVFGSAGRTTLSAQAQHVAVQQGQAELERMASLPYNQLALTGAPESSSDPLHPGAKVAGASFTVRAGLTEPLVLSAEGGQTPQVAPGAETFAVGSGGATITGKVYRYVTWRDENCPPSLCDGAQDTKRLTVAVTVDAPYRPSNRPPLWMSTVVADPSSVPPGAQSPPGGTPHSGPPVTAQSFYLYDTPCSQTARQPQSGNHPVRNTASSGAVADDNSTCEHPSEDHQPDLMAPSAPPGDPLDPLHTYSTDVTGGYEGGLATIKAGSSCTHSYDAAEATRPDVPSKWSVHAWSSAVLPQLLHLDGQATVSLFTVTVGGVAASGRLCATLIDRTVADGTPTDRVLGAATYSLGAWPGSPRRVTFTFHLPQAEDVPAGHRLVLALHSREESSSDLVYLYDHPLYPSLLELATTTPL